MRYQHSLGYQLLRLLKNIDVNWNNYHLLFYRCVEIKKIYICEERIMLQFNEMISKLTSRAAAKDNGNDNNYSSFFMSIRYF